MLLFLDSTLAHMISWLASHPDAAYYILFLGGYFETLIGTCFFIPGEIFLLSGSILAGSHILALPYVLLALYGGAVLGDSSSYFIGRMVGPSIFQPGRRFFNTENYQKGEAVFEKYGTTGIFLARFLGPISWITPFLAGIYRVPYRTFLPFNLAGIFFGVGQFIVAGYFFGRHSSAILPFVHRYLFLLLIIAALAFITVHYRKRRSSAKR